MTSQLLGRVGELGGAALTCLLRAAWRPEGSWVVPEDSDTSGFESWLSSLAKTLSIQASEALSSRAVVPISGVTRTKCHVRLLAT